MTIRPLVVYNSLCRDELEATISVDDEEPIEPQIRSGIKKFFGYGKREEGWDKYLNKSFPQEWKWEEASREDINKTSFHVPVLIREYTFKKALFQRGQPPRPGVKRAWIRNGKLSWRDENGRFTVRPRGVTGAIGTW